ncbi:MAG: hypothetical protein R3353_11745 [Salegentibacter mishustinae]|jgi:hypothetical protein|nr:hypothetical protein [Salegentibacter mishustinae]
MKNSSYLLLGMNYYKIVVISTITGIVNKVLMLYNARKNNF